MQKILIIIILLSSNSVLVLGLCPARCECDDEKLVVMCKAAHLDVVPITLNPELKELHLKSNQIKSIMSSFTVYHNLEYLDISENSIVSVGRKNFAMQRKLRVLLIGSNHISEVNNHSFHGLSSLQILHLNNNFIKKLPSRIFSGLNKLEKLDLSRNTISSITQETFAGLINLKTLLLRDNKLTAIPSESFAHLPNLVKLDLGINLLIEIPEFAFSSLASLEDLSIDICSVTSIQNNAFKHLDHLKSLKLQDNDLEKIPQEAIETLKNLEELILSNNKIKKVDSFALRGLKRLKIFAISNTDQLQTIDKNAFSENHFLQKLLIEFNKNLKNLDPGIFDSQSNSLKYISLRGNQFSHLHSHLVYWEQLEYLDIRENPFHCNCSILWLWKLLNRSNFTTREEVFCYSPPNLSGLPLLFLPSSDIECYETKNSQLITGTVIFFMIICCVSCIFMAIIFRNKLTWFINKKNYDTSLFPSYTDDLSYEKGRIIDSHVICTPSTTIMIHHPIKVAPISQV